MDQETEGSCGDFADYGGEKIQIPYDYLMPGIRPLLPRLMCLTLQISLRHSSTVSRSIPATHSTAYVLSAALMNLRPVASSTPRNCFLSR